MVFAKSTPTNSPARGRAASGRAFTIVELLIVIGILVLLVAVALVAMRVVKKNANRLQTTNALRQMMSAYTAYATDHKGKLMPGFIDQGDFVTNGGTLDIKAKLKSGHVLDAQDTSSYVWRLSPYLDHNWQVMFTDYRSPGVMTKAEEEYGAGDSSGKFGPSNTDPNLDMVIASHPSYGLNSIFLCGDSAHASLGSLAPWKVASGVKPLAITRLSDAMDPAKIVVFAPSQSPPPPSPAAIGPDDPTGSVRRGYMELRPPMFNYTDANGMSIPQQWSLNAADDRIQVVTPDSVGMGVPIDRMGDDKIATARLDGSVDTEFLGRLVIDMRLWDPRKVTPN